jgi:hypothetical protein
MSLCHHVIVIMSLSLCHCHYVIMSSCHYVIMSLSLCHVIMSLSLCHYVIMSLCHYVIVIMSLCHYVIMSLSLCHYVIMSFHCFLLFKLTLIKLQSEGQAGEAKNSDIKERCLGCRGALERNVTWQYLSAKCFQISSSSTGTTAHCGLWPVEQDPSSLSLYLVGRLVELYRVYRDFRA